MDLSNSTDSNISSIPGLHPSQCRLASAVMLSLFFSVGVPGNIAVIILKPNWEHLSSLTQSLMLNLAVSDLLGLLTLPFWIDAALYGWKFNSVFCKLLAYGTSCSICGSQLTVIGLSVQRYLLVVHQYKFRQVPNRLLLVLLWLIAGIMCIPNLMIWKLESKSVPNQQWTEFQLKCSSRTQCLAVLMTENITGMISLFIVVFSYICVCRKVNQSAFFNNPQTTRLITNIVVSFVVFWTPYYSIKVLAIVGVSHGYTEPDDFFIDTWIIVTSVLHVYKCLNPFLYAFTSRKFCKVCIKLEPTDLEQRVPDTATTTELS